MPTISSFKSRLENYFAAEGLLFLGIVEITAEPAFKHFEAWLAAKKNAGMRFLEEHLELRANPAGILPDAKSALMFAFDYGRASLADAAKPRIARYAQFNDYHKWMKTSGERVIAKVAADSFVTENKIIFQSRVTVDSAPILERALADKTTAGFIGKNTCYIHPEQGSLLLLAEILVDVVLPPDDKIPVDPTQRQSRGGCGTCKRCQVHCPTGALSVDYQIDARRCISYWTIEHRGTIPEEFWPQLGEYFFGCDICQNVCPYNRGVEISDGNVPMRLPRIADLPPLAEVATMDQAYYERVFGGTPLTRAKRDGLRRNALIGMYVRQDAQLAAVIVQLNSDTSPVIHATLQQIKASPLLG